MSTTRQFSIAHVLWSGHVGGIERLATDLAAEQVRYGMRVGLAFGQAAGPFCESAEATGSEVADLGFATGYDIRPRRISRATSMLSWADVIHLHGYNLAFDRLCHRAARPIVFTEHGNFGQGRALGLGHRAKERLKARFLRKTVSVVAANSVYTTVRLAHLYGIAEEAVHVVYNGARFAPLLRDEFSPRPNRELLQVAFVGRLAGFKRVDRLIDGVARMQDPGRVTVTVAGGGPLEADLRARAAAAGVAEQVRFVGFCQDVDSLFASADCLVQSSEGEPFGLTIVEGCAAGALPIVFADGGGALEVIPPDGIVVRDVDELASTFERLHGSHAISSEARLARATWARETFPISRTHETYHELYRLALTNGST